jgi:nucleoside-diphosphate-sugar epimerase
MQVLILGAGGFLGRHLSQHLATSGRLAGQPIDTLVLFDRQAVAAPPARCTVRTVQGDLRDSATLQALFGEPVDCVFHLAATLTVDAESDFERGLQTNVLGFMALLDHCRAQAQAHHRPPLLLFASSIATYGGRLPAVVGDDVFQAPTTSYGAHKAVAELLLADHSRHGFVDGRALRLPIVLTHPGPASGSVSDQIAALVREPLRGQPTRCALAPDSALVVASVDQVIAGLVRLAGVPAAALPPSRAMNLPGLTVTPRALLQAVQDRLPPGRTPQVDWQPDAGLQQIIDGWPQALVSARAAALGFVPDASADALVQSFLAHESAP